MILTVSAYSREAGKLHSEGTWRIMATDEARRYTLRLTAEGYSTLTKVNNIPVAYTGMSKKESQSL